MIDKVPQSLEAEENLIACILVDPECLPTVRELVQPSDFFNDYARLVYLACLAVPVVNQATVHYELDRLGHLDTIGRDYLSNLIRNNPGLYPEFNAREVKQASYNRQVIGLAGELSRLGYTGNATPEQVQELIWPFTKAPKLETNQYRGIRRAT